MADPITPDAVALQKAHFVNTVETTSDSTFTVQFNPKELRLDDRANYSPDQGEQSGNRQQFNGRDGAKLSMELIFDTTLGWDSRDDDPVNVNEQFVKPLRAFLSLAEAQDPSSDRETQSCEDRPPPVQFVWGPFEFTGVIDSVNTTFLMFSSQGVPVRARVGLTMTTDRPESTTGNEQTDQTRLLPTLVAQRAGTDVFSAARKAGVSEQDVLLANGIDDPLGDVDLASVTIPDSSELAERIRDAFRDIPPKSVFGITEEDVLEAIDTVEQKLEEVGEAIDVAKEEAQRAVDETNETIGAINEKVDDAEETAREVADKLPERIRPEIPDIPDIPEIPDIPDFEPPF
ncbi:MAG: hypothetical protein AAF211_02915 [Myxococcota bacterium]